MKIKMFVECQCCGYTRTYVMTDCVVSVDKFWRVTPSGDTYCGGEECDDEANAAGAVTVPPFVIDF